MLPPDVRFIQGTIVPLLLGADKVKEPYEIQGYLDIIIEFMKKACILQIVFLHSFPFRFLS